MSKLEKKSGRMFIYANDVALITGRSYKTALKILNRVRTQCNKPAGALVSYKEFCVYMNLDEEEVFNSLQ